MIEMENDNTVPVEGIEEAEEQLQAQPETESETEPTKEESEKVQRQEGANVRLTGKCRSLEGFLSIGDNKPIQMPDEAQQRAGFKVDNPQLLINQFPWDYKHDVTETRNETGGTE